MKIVSKAYLLISILIAIAVVNLFLFYSAQRSEVDQSNSILKLGDLKVKAESISGLSTSVASGNTEDHEKLIDEIEEIESILDILKRGGNIDGLNVGSIPQDAINSYNSVINEWNDYKQKTLLAEKTRVFDPDAVNAINYVLQKNGELALLTDQLVRELDNLDRDYNRHKEIAREIVDHRRSIAQQTLLISIGEGTNIQEELRIHRLSFDIGLRKLLGISTNGLDVQSVGLEHENLTPLARENSETLRQLDPLWESIRTRIITLEDKTLLSSQFGTARNSMNEQKMALFDTVDSLILEWNDSIQNQSEQEQLIIQILLGVDIIVFIIVLIVVRQSLSPLEIIIKALTRVREGVYGEKINYTASDEVGELVNTFNIMSDTIAEKESQTKKTDIAKDEFLAMITHELKTPLVPIQGYADILLSEHLGKLTEKQKERLAIIKVSAQTLLDIISDLLDAQKLELGQLRMKREYTNIADTVDKAVKALKPQIDQHGIELVLNIKNITVNHDPERITQVLTNLIKNSVTAVSNKAGRIEIVIEDSQDHVIVKIIDNGIGIPFDKQKELFKKFYQVDASLTRERGGSGLGLAICRGIIENHGGKISMTSTQGQGSTFLFTLPKTQQGRTPI